MKETEAKNIGQVINEHAAEMAGKEVAEHITALGTAQQSAKVKKSPAKKAPPKNDAAETAVRLQREIDAKKEALQATLRDLEYKQRLNRHRSKFIGTIDQLESFKEKLQQTEDFETNICRLSFSEGSYNRTDLFSISATPVLLDCIEYLCDRIRQKVADIEAELIK